MPMPKGKNPRNKDGLTPLQARFLDEYFLDMNATAALKRAGSKMADPNNCVTKFMRHPIIQAKIEEHLKKRAEKAEKKAADVVNELIKIAFGNITDCIEIHNGRLKVKDTNSWSEATKGFISEIKESDKGALSIKTQDKVKSLELLGKHFGMWKEKDAEANRQGADAAIFEGLQNVFSKLAK